LNQPQPSRNLLACSVPEKNTYVVEFVRHKNCSEHMFTRNIYTGSKRGKNRFVWNGLYTNLLLLLWIGTDRPT
jgi:hypothetical protein